MTDFGDLVALCLFGSVLVSGCWWFVGFGGGFGLVSVWLGLRLRFLGFGAI